MVCSRSFFQMISRHPSHFSQSPSVRTVRSEASVWVLESVSRLNQDMEGVNDHDSTLGAARYWPDPGFEARGSGTARSISATPAGKTSIRLISRQPASPGLVRAAAKTACFMTLSYRQGAVLTDWFCA
jgi:hypothetical protein